MNWAFRAIMAIFSVLYLLHACEARAQSPASRYPVIAQVPVDPTICYAGHEYSGWRTRTGRYVITNNTPFFAELKLGTQGIDVMDFPTHGQSPPFRTRAEVRIGSRESVSVLAPGASCYGAGLPGGRHDIRASLYQPSFAAPNDGTEQYIPNCFGMTRTNGMSVFMDGHVRIYDNPTPAGSWSSQMLIRSAASEPRSIIECSAVMMPGAN